ncbi:hypothetical protein [Actinoplanes teichomyceticus]|uniref:Integral membrane protein n=1 Tax=Actinoplanes teichomyceticus TaxID=1867 RepID=A0A561WK52_ACTTI|nr:hypothetical protein [Actinoplanes teichomyceticus]TWG24247.1 hypothetical protein FHX34_102800 [Actinoplanes teichomyceticus]GIF12907.1 hypothetical protein Ate01nite_29390 [Actinoplanes teichomyceticus]
MADAEASAAERELALLRAENERLRALLAARPPAQRRRRGGRWALATTLLLAGCLLLPVGAVALWARAVVFDTDRYVGATAPLARDPAVQDAVADRITAEVVAVLHVDGITTRVLDALVKQGAPAELAVLRRPVVEAVQSFARAQIGDVVRSDRFVRAWEQANRAAHEGLVAALRGTGDGVIGIQDGTVSVDLGAFLAMIKPQLVAAGVPFADRIPAVSLTFPIVQSAQIPRIQRAAGLLDTLAVPSVVLALLLLVVAIGVAPGRRRMLAVAGFGTAAVLLALLGALALGRGYYLRHLPAGGIASGAAAAVWDALVGQLRLRVLAVVAAGLTIGLGGWLTGPGRAARELRAGAGWLLVALRLGARRLGWGSTVADRWVAAHATALRTAAVLLVVTVYALWTRPTGAVVLGLALALLALVAVIELLRTGTKPPVAGPAARPAR